MRQQNFSLLNWRVLCCTVSELTVCIVVTFLLMATTNKTDQVIGITGQAGNQTVLVICNIPSSSQENITNTLLPIGQMARRINHPGQDEKKLILAQEKQRILLAKNELREKKEANRLAKEQEKQRKEAERLAKEQEKKRKEEERLKQREKEEEIKKERKEKRETERKRKLDENAEKQELKRIKEMKKREKETMEEEKKKKDENRFRKFFVSSPNNVQNESMNATQSPSPRQPQSCDRCHELDVHLQEQNLTSTYLSSSKRVRYKNKNMLKFKLFQFSENHRPPYWGTCGKHSTIVTPRAPFNKDEKLLDYTVDSDEEWEEEEPGESLTDSEVEDDRGGSHSNDEEEDDGFFVPHGYLSDDEGNASDEEICNRERKQLTEVDSWEAECSRKCRHLVPRYVGIVTKGNELIQELVKHSGVVINTATPITCTTVDNNVMQQDDTPQSNAVPERAMPDLIRHIHKNNTGLKKLTETFREYWATKSDPSVKRPLSNDCGISKRQLELKIVSIATKDGHHGYWNVNSEVIKQYGILEDQLLVPITVDRSSPDTGKRKTPKGLRDIKQFFKKSPDETRLTDTTQSPPIKKRRISLTPMFIIDSEGEKENNEVKITPLRGGGIDWQKTRQERNKISVSIDIHI